MLILSRKMNQKIKIGEEITVTIIEIRGDQVKIGVPLQFGQFQNGLDGLDLRRILS